MNNFYEKLEPNIREIVRFLRDNGINTECSCEHDKYIQCQYILDGFIFELDELLFNAGFRNYKIDINLKRTDGHLYKTLQISFVNLYVEDVKSSCLDFKEYKIDKKKY